jgi:N4-gp56 family major capsid protein
VADQNTSIVNNDNLLSSYFERRAIRVLQDKVYYYQAVQKDGMVFQIPQGEGQQITWNAFRRLAAASSFLAEASGNSAVSLSSRKVNVTVNSLGRTVKLTDLLEFTSVLNVNEGAMRRIEDSAALTVDNALQMAVFKGTGTVARLQVGQLADTKTKILSALMSARASSFCANTGTAESGRLQWGLPVVFGHSATSTEFRLSAINAAAPSISARLGPIGIRKAVTRLKRLNIEPLANGKYLGIAHPNAIATMMGNSDWKDWQKNWSGGPTSTMYKHQVGEVHQVALVESNNQPRYAVAAHSVNITTILGAGCLGAAELDGSVKFIITRPGPQSTNDPFQLNSYIAFKVRMAGAVLDPSAGVHLLTHEKVG